MAGAGHLVSFDGPPDGSEDHHRGSQPSCDKALDAFPRRPMRRLAACRCRQSARQRFGAGPLPWSAVPGTAGDPSPALRRAPSHDGSGFVMPGFRPAMLLARTPSPPRPLRRRSMRQADWSADNGAGPRIRCVAGPRDSRSVDWFDHAGTPFPPRLRGAIDCSEQYARHHWITKGFCLTALAATALQGELHPVTTGIPPHPPMRRIGHATSCDPLGGSEGAPLKPPSHEECRLSLANLTAEWPPSLRLAKTVLYRPLLPCEM